MVTIKYKKGDLVRFKTAEECKADGTVQYSESIFRDYNLFKDVVYEVLADSKNNTTITIMSKDLKKQAKYNTASFGTGSISVDGAQITFQDEFINQKFKEIFG